MTFRWINEFVVLDDSFSIWAPDVQVSSWLIEHLMCKWVRDDWFTYWVGNIENDHALNLYLDDFIELTHWVRDSLSIRCAIEFVTIGWRIESVISKMITHSIYGKMTHWIDALSSWYFRWRIEFVVFRWLIGFVKALCVLAIYSEFTGLFSEFIGLFSEYIGPFWFIVLFWEYIVLFWERVMRVYR